MGGWSQSPAAPPAALLKGWQKTCIDNGSFFGIPSVITSDKGPHFGHSAWWEALCAAHGVRRAYSQPYHHRANGKAESAGHQLREKLKRLIADVQEPLVSWVDLLPKALRFIHDTPGESGFSPYEIVFGRQRSLGGIPYRPLLKAVDAQDWFARQKQLDEKIAKILNSRHEKQANKVNSKLVEPPPLKVGAVVWYCAEEGLVKDKLQPIWQGPGKIVEKRGKDSYVVELGLKNLQEAHRDQLRPHVDDVFAEQPLPLNYFSGKAPVLEPILGPDEYLPESILDHEVRDGVTKVLVKWKGWKDPTWEPLNELMNEVLKPYAMAKNLKPVFFGRGFSEAGFPHFYVPLDSLRHSVAIMLREVIFGFFCHSLSFFLFFSLQLNASS